MNLNVTFKENNKSFSPDFGEVNNIVDKTIALTIIEKTITTYSNNQLKTIGNSAFIYCSKLESIDVPEVVTIGQKGLNSCTSLKQVIFPKLTTLLPGDNLTYCYALEYVDFGLVSNIPSWCLANCKALKTLILRKSDKICTLQTTNALDGTPIKSGTGFVYVPDNLVEQYKTAANWSTFASQIKPISELG